LISYYASMMPSVQPSKLFEDAPSPNEFSEQKV